MRYLLIGIWHGEAPHVQRRPTDRKEGAEGAAFLLTRCADRDDVPHEVLMIESFRGPHVAYEWRKDHEYGQEDFDQMLDELRQDPPVRTE